MKITVIGAGKVGVEIARRLVGEGHDLVLIDRDENKLSRLEGHLDALMLRGSGSSATILKHPDVAASDMIAAVTNADEVNMIACMMAKKLGVARTIARIRDPVYARDLVISKEDLGLDLILNPEHTAAMEIARQLTFSLPVHTEPFAGGKVQLAEISIDETHRAFIDRKLLDIQLPASCLIVGISRQGEIIVPGGRDIIKPGDTLYILGHANGVEKLCARIKKRRPRASSVIILGGGRIGFYLGERLCSLGIRPKIIEQNHERCHDLAERLPEALILEADGSDIDLLKREGIKDTDGFVAVTGFDEENLLLALLAKQMGAKRVIAKVSRPNYAPLVEHLGVDIAISPRLIMASAILRYIRGGRLLSLVLLLNGQAEVVELILQPESRMIGKPLRRLGLPKGVIVGAIKRGNQIIIPKGDEIVQDSDRLTVFAVGYSVDAIDRLFNQGR